MNRVEVRDKLWRIIREMLLSNIESSDEIPERITNYILENHGWTVGNNLNSYTEDDLNSFVKTLQKCIEDTHLLIDNSNNSKWEEVEYDFSKTFEKYLETESEYAEVTLELVRILEEMVKQKEKYSQHFKSKCKCLESNMDVLCCKSQFLKLQFFLKLYGEGHALRAHLKLRQNLRNELEALKQRHNELVEINKQYDEIKNDKKFCELFKVYKELKKIEKRTEIIGQM